MFRFKILKFWLIGIISVFGFIACGDSSIKYEDVKGSSFRVKKISQNQVEISWSAIKGAMYYNIRYKEFQLHQGKIISDTVQHLSQKN